MFLDIENLTIDFYNQMAEKEQIDFSKNPNKLSALEKWKCLFLCSIFGMLVQKK